MLMLANPCPSVTNAMADSLAAIERETAPDPEYSVIWLHGLGADGSDFVPIVPELRLPPRPGVRFIFPHAPMIPVTCNAGYVMRAWYDIRYFDAVDAHADVAGILASREAIRRLIERETGRGVPTGNIVLAGFSQGGAMAYTAGLTHPQRLAGIVALSAYLPAPSLIAGEFSAANRDVPIFAGHGTEDDVVPFELGLLARGTVAQYTDSMEWHSYGMPHSVCPEEIEAVGEWLGARLAR
jgi:phospholipase/carboxylesterase